MSSRANCNTEEETSSQWEDIRDEMHNAIDNRNHAIVKYCCQAVPQLTYWLHPITKQSAVHRAIQKNAFDIYGLLLSHKCDFKDEEEKQCFLDLNRLQRSELQRQQFVVTSYEGSYLNLLKSRTQTQAECEDFVPLVDRSFQELDSNELIRPILQAAATSHHLRIRFDFERDDVQCMIGCPSRYNLGITDNETEGIFIGAKAAKSATGASDVVATLAHELCHRALYLVYMNSGRPYRSDDDDRKHAYQKIIQRMEARKEELDPTIGLAFDYDTEQELIVRVPHILALHGSPGSGDSILQSQAPELFDFYKQCIIPDIMTYIRHACPGKDAEKIKEENARLGKAYWADALNVSFNDKLRFKDLKDAPVVFLTGPNLSLLEIMVHSAVKSTGQPYLFFDASQWERKLHQVLVANKCNFILLTCNGRINSPFILELLSEISNVVGTKVILLAERAAIEYAVNVVKEGGFFGGVKDHYVAEIDKASFENITQKCKDEVRVKSHIRLQGREYRVPLKKVVQSKDFDKFIDTSTFLQLCQLRYLEVGPSLYKQAEDVNAYYVKRRFIRTATDSNEMYDEKYLLTTTEKVVAVCGAPGIGKSALASWLSIKLKEADEKRWVLHVNLPQRIGFVNLRTEVNDLQQLATVCGVRTDGFEFALFRESMQHNEWQHIDTSLAIVIIFDAFDEVHETDRGYILKLVKYLEQTRVSKIYLLGRTIYKSLLCDVVGSAPLEMEPFSESNLVVFLMKYWVAHGVTHMSDGDLLFAATETVQSYLTSMGKDRTASCNPLLIRMVAEHEQSTLHQVQNIPSSGSSGNLAQDVRRGSRSMFEIYRMFVDYRYKIYVREKLQVDLNSANDEIRYENEMRQRHFYHKLGLLAMRVIFDTSELKNMLKADELADLEPGGRCMNHIAKGRLQHGLLEGLRDGVPVFVHKTFAEFLAGHFLHSRIKNQEQVLSPERYLMRGASEKESDDVYYSDSDSDTEEIIRGMAKKRKKKVSSVARSVFRKKEEHNPVLMMHVLEMYGKVDYQQVLFFLDSFAAASCPLHLAVISANAFYRRYVTEENLQVLDDFDRSVLHVAALHGHVDILKILPMRAPLVLKDRFGMTPLMYLDKLDAVRRKRWKDKKDRNEDMETWADCIALRTLDMFCFRLLDAQVAWDKELPKIFRNVMKEEGLKESVLYHAMAGRFYSLLKVLLSQFCRKRTKCSQWKDPRRVDVDTIRTPKLRTLLFYADSAAVLELFLSYSSIRVVDENGGTPLHYAASRAPLNCDNELMETANEAGKGQTSAVQLLLLRLSACHRDNRGYNPLQYACVRREPDFIKMLLPHSSVHHGDRDEIHPPPYSIFEFPHTLCSPPVTLLASFCYSPEKLCAVMSGLEKGISSHRPFEALLPYVDTAEEGYCTMMFTLLRNHVPLEKHEQAMVKQLLLRFTCKVPYLFAYDCNVLHHFIGCGNVEAVKLLLPHSSLGHCHLYSSERSYRMEKMEELIGRWRLLKEQRHRNW